MSMHDVIEKIRIVARAEMTLFKAEARRTRTTMLLMSMAVGCLFIAVVLLNFALFFYFTKATVESEAAFILCAINLVLALIPMLIAHQIKPGMEEAMVKDIRDMAVNSLTAEAKQLEQETKSMHESLSLLKTGVSGSVNSLSALLPFVSILIKALKKNK